MSRAPAYVLDDKGVSSPAATVVVMVNNVVGAGIVSLPWTLLMMSTGVGVGALVVCAALAASASIVLAECADLAGTFNYRAMTVKAFGSRAGTWVQAVMGLYTLGSCVSYVVLVGDFVPSVLQGMGASGEEHCRRRACIAVSPAMWVCVAICNDAMCACVCMQACMCLRYVCVCACFCVCLSV